MAHDADTYEAQDAKAEFYAYCANLPVDIAEKVEASAWANSWADGVRGEYSSDLEAWQIALSTARMIADDPASFGI